MLKKSLVLPFLGIAVAGGLAACNDHHFNNGGVDPSGIYEGTLTDSVTQQTTPVTLIIDENGQGRMAGQNGTYYLLNGIFTSGGNVFAGFNGFSSSADFPNGGLITTGHLQGFVTNPGLNATYTAQGNDSGSITLTFDQALYVQRSSLAMLAGTYTSTSSTPTYSFTVTNTGSLSGTDSNGCTYTGGFAIVDSHLNAYEEAFSQTCGSTTVTFNGQADFVATPTPAQINLLADDNAGQFIAITLHQ
jgi:hypothetical protein